MRLEHFGDTFPEVGVANVIEVNGSSLVGRSAFRRFGLSGLYSIGFFGFLGLFKRQVQHRLERPVGLTGKCVYGGWALFGVRDYSTLRKALRGFS